MKVAKSRILVPVDGSEYSTKALDVAVDLARALDAELIILHVVDLARVAMLSAGQAELIPGCLQELEAEGRQIAEDGAHRVARGVGASKLVPIGHGQHRRGPAPCTRAGNDRSAAAPLESAR